MAHRFGVVAHQEVEVPARGRPASADRGEEAINSIAQRASATQLSRARSLSVLAEQIAAPAPATKHVLGAQHVGLLGIDVLVLERPVDAVGVIQAERLSP